MTSRTADITLNVAPHPFSLERVTHKVSAGRSIAGMMEEMQPHALLRRHAHVLLDGHVIAPQDWARVYPKQGAVLTVRMVPQGGGRGGKNPLQTVLSIAVLAASPVIASTLVGALGATGSFMGISAARLITGGVNLLGRLAINALAPPARPRYGFGQKDAPVYSIQAAQNRVEHFARVPKVLGRHRFVPPLGAMPYTETVGGDQYLRMLFVWGYGPLEISELKIGETALSEFEGVEVESRQGFADDAPLTLYSNAVLQNDLQVSLRQAGGYVVRTSDADAEELSVDVTFARGLFRFGQGNAKQATTVDIEVQYAPAGTQAWSTGAVTPRGVEALQMPVAPAPAPYESAGALYAVQRIDRIVIDAASGQISTLHGQSFRSGIDSAAAQTPTLPEGVFSLASLAVSSHAAPVVTDERDRLPVSVKLVQVDDFKVTLEEGSVHVAAGALTYNPLRVTAKQSTTLRRAVGFKVPKGRYDVRLRRLTDDAVDDNVFDECAWTALRTVRSTMPVRMNGLAMTALRIKATDQLNGVIDRFNGVVQALVPDWTGSEWRVQPTSNPAALYLHVLQGAGNNRPLGDMRLDIGRLQAWHERCHLQGYAFDAVVDYDTSVREVLQDIAATGRASPAIIDGKWSVVEDVAQTVPVQHFTPRNTYAFEAQKAFDEQPEALRVRFINRDKGWVADERLVFRDGIDEAHAQKYETLELTGVTSAEQAWKLGRYHLATAILRPETYQFSADIEHLVCTRGDMVRLTHDVPMFGLSSARIISCLLNQEEMVDRVSLDAAMVMEAGKAYSLRCRRKDGSSLVLPLQTQVGQMRTLVLASPVERDLAPEAGDLAMFGESGQESVALVVKSIEPHGDLSARVTCVDAAPEIYLADQGEIPSFRSNISLSGIGQPPPAPEIVNMQSGEESLIRHADGSLTTRIVLTLRPPVYSYALDAQVLLRGEGEDRFVPADILSESPTQISIMGIEEGQRYDIQVRYIAANNNRSLPRLVSGYQVAGTTALPSRVERLDISVVGDVAHLSWPAVGDIDLSHYCIRHAAMGAGMSWSNAIDIALRVPYDTTTVSLPALPGVYLIKAVDVGGRMSEEAALVRSPVSYLQGYNAVLSIDEGAGFLGQKTGLVRLAGGLCLDSIDEIDSIVAFDGIENIDTGASGLKTSGLYHFSALHDLGAVYTSRITAVIGVQGLDMSTSVDQWSNVDTNESWDTDVDPSVWSVTLQVSCTDDDPALAVAAWTPWSNLTIADYTARAYRFRMLLESASATVTPVVHALTVHIDMPDRYESAGDLVHPPEGGVVNFASAFREKPVLQITPYDMQTGDYFALTDVWAGGFSLRFLDSAGAGVSRRFDYVAKGYGHVSSV